MTLPHGGSVKEGWEIQPVIGSEGHAKEYDVS